MPHRRVQGASIKTVTSRDVTRLLFLDGEKGSVACRVHGSIIASPFPRFSPEKNTIETSLRSRLRLNNLVAVRGVPGEGMIGPADYYGNWEKPEKYSYSIAINQGVPAIYQHNTKESPTRSVRPIAKNEITTVKAHWISGTDREIIKKKLEYQRADQPLTGDSLFNNSGILEIESLDQNIQLKQFDATTVDLTPFKARLVANDQSFKITTTPIPTADEWRAVSYHYDQGYAARQVKHGGGLFLETHDFPQSITPLNSSTAGFVTLGRWQDEQKKEVLELIGIRIPFGFTLIIEKGSIHGDTDVAGMFMMCMTSNHVTMNSANTVFLKNPGTKKNISLFLEDNLGSADKHLIHQQQIAPKPLVIYNGHENFKEFHEKTKGMNFMFNPFSAGWWKKTLDDMQHISLPLLGAFVAASIAITIALMATLGLGVAVVIAGSVSLATTGFFASRVYQESKNHAPLLQPNNRLAPA